VLTKSDWRKSEKGEKPNENQNTRQSLPKSQSQIRNGKTLSHSGQSLSKAKTSNKNIYLYMNTSNYEAMTRQVLDFYLESLERKKIDFYHNPSEQDRITELQTEALTGWLNYHYPPTIN
jgi:hypothetical protein